MKRALVPLILIAFSALGDERAEKRQLASELLEVIDGKGLIQTSLENFMNTLGIAMGDAGAADVPEEYRAQWEENQKREAERMRAFRERLFTHIDYDRYFEETYLPLFEEQFTVEELRELIAFFRTKHGQKMAKIVPRLGTGAEVEAMNVLQEAVKKTQEELAKEDAAKNPWKATMRDIRSIATAVEARATDEDSYPNVTFEGLEELVEPTYIHEMPKTDTWGTPFLYVGGGTHYRIVSAGADRRFEWSSRHLDLSDTEMRISEDPDADIIFQDGIFLQAPREQ